MTVRSPSNKIKAWKWGVWAEWYGSLWLRHKGYKILKRRFKTPVGEIDLVAQKGTILAFVEVKYRPSLDEAAFAITPHQRQRIERAAQYYLALHPAVSRFDLRFDAILITPKGRLKHIKNAWQSGY